MVDWSSTLFALVCGVFTCPSLGAAAPLHEASALYRLHYSENALSALETSEDTSAAKSGLHGRVLMQLNRPGPSIPLLEKARQETHLRGPLCLDLVRALRLNGEFDRARTLLDSCPDQSLQYHLEEARIMTGKSGPVQALPLWKNLLKQRRKGTPFSVVRWEIVRGLEGSNRSDKAFQQRKRLAIRWPHTPEGKSCSTSDLLQTFSLREKIEHATRLWDVRLYDEAYTAYGRLLTDEKQKDEAHLMMGRLLSERKRSLYPKAIEHFQA